MRAITAGFKTALTRIVWEGEAPAEPFFECDLSRAARQSATADRPPIFEITSMKSKWLSCGLSLLALFALLCSAARLQAEDVVDRKGTTTPLRGDVKEVSRTEVLLKGRNNQREYRIPANEIERIRWQGELAQLTQARVEERNGQFDKAIAGYEAALKASSSENLTTDLEFLIARTTASKALADEENYDEPISRLEKFRESHPSSFHYFESLKLLARLYMAKPDVEKANATMKLLSEAPWNDFKMEADILRAQVAVAHGQIDAALGPLDNVLSVKPATPAEWSRRYEALLTKASCLQKQNKFQEAIDVLTSILDEAADDDTKTLAETCVRLGDCYQAAGRTREAILAYLRVDLLFPKEKANHAESLYYLSRLFAQDGKFDKAADASARLQQAYPHSPWTAKLAAAPK
jgi:tetratricopeptide (TPR) repeat protein